MRADELDFKLPPELIAQSPATLRAASRLLHYRRGDRSVAHRAFSDLPQLLRKGGLLVFNDARVLPARFMLVKSTGGKVDALFLREIATGRWSVLLRNLVRYAGPLHFAHAPETFARIVHSSGGGNHEIEVGTDLPAVDFLARVGRMPLPPYIKRGREQDDRDASDQERYQTVYARTPGSVAAPTAGLHFTPEVLAALDAAGVERAFVTLHVGLGTFKPVTSQTLEAHEMHSESYAIDPAAAEALNQAKADGRRIIAIGTTSARVLESQPADRPFEPKIGETAIFIYPPYAWKHVGALVTNFHLPRSTLIALLAALTGLEEQRRLYALAVEEKYRFFSYGDAMFVE